jgi:hypothetical protein
MSSIRDNALLILRFMVEQSANVVSRSLRARDIQDNLGLSDVEFSCADQYLLSSGYIKGAMSGLEGPRWVDPSGIDFLDCERRQMIPPSLTAERVLRTAINMENKGSGEGVGGREIWEQLAITSQDYQMAARELADEGFIEDVLQISEAPFLEIKVTSEGRRAFRRGFKQQDLHSGVSIGAYFAGPVSDANILAIAQAHQSHIEQMISQNDQASLRDEIGHLLEQLVEAVRDELETNQLVAYEKAAQDLRAETNKDKPNPSLIQKCLNVLNLADTLDGTIEFGKKAMELSLRVAPLIQLLQTVIVRLFQ